MNRKYVYILTKRPGKSIEKAFRRSMFHVYKSGLGIAVSSTFLNFKKKSVLPGWVVSHLTAKSLIRWTFGHGVLTLPAELVR